MLKKAVKKNKLSASRFSKGAGFTMIELVLVVAIGVVLATVGVINIQKFRDSKDIEFSLNELAAAVEETRSRSVTQENGERWSVRFISTSTGTDAYEIYTGAVYASSNVVSYRSLRRSVKFGEPSGDRTIDLNFEPVTGRLANKKVITLASGKGVQRIGDVIVDTFGRVTKRIEDDVVGYWHFDEGTGGTAYDALGAGKNGILTGSVSWASVGKAGAAVDCNNTTTDYINVSATVDLSSVWTITAWFKYPLATVGANWWTLTRGNAGDHQIIVRRSDSLLGMYDNIEATGFNSSGYVFTSLSTGWHYIAVTGNGGVQQFYIDGSYVGQTSKQSTTDVRAICNYQGGSQNWGTVDEVRIWSRALTADEVKARYNDLR